MTLELAAWAILRHITSTTGIARCCTRVARCCARVVRWCTKVVGVIRLAARIRGLAVGGCRLLGVWQLLAAGGGTVALGRGAWIAHWRAGAVVCGIPGAIHATSC